MASRTRLTLSTAVVACLAAGGAVAGIALQRSPTRLLRGTIGEGSFASAALRGRDHFSIYLPPGYARASRRYPVIYFLHGLPGAPGSYRSIGTVAAAVEQSGHPAIVVGVQGSRQGDADPEWRNWGPGRNWETATAVELVHVIDSRYRTIATRRGRVLVGISAGGYGATLIAAHNPGTYSVIESWSGYFQATNPAGTAVLDLGSAEANEWADFSKQVPLLRKRFAPWLTTTWYGFYIGTNDRRFLDVNRQIAAELREYKIPHVYFRIYDGTHSWTLWRGHAIEWIGRGLERAAQPAG